MRRVAAVLAILVAVAGATYWLAFRGGDEPLAFQGYMEGNLVFMAAEESGRIERLAQMRLQQTAETVFRQ